MSKQRIKIIFLYLILLFSIILVSTIFYLRNGFNYLHSLELIVLGITSLLLLFIPEFIRKREDLFEPIHWVMLTLLFGVTLRTIFIAFGDKAYAEQWFFIKGDISFLLIGGLIILTGIFSFILGYLLPVRSTILANMPIVRREKWNKKRLFLVIFSFITISIIATIDFIRKAGIDFSTLYSASDKRMIMVQASNLVYTPLGYHRWGVLLASIAFLIYFALIITNKKLQPLNYVWLILLFLWASFFPFITSTRTSLLFTIMFATMIFHYIKRKIQVKYLLLIAIFAICILLFLAIIRPPEGQTINLSINGVSNLADSIIKSLVGNTNFLGIEKTSHIVNDLGKEIQPKNGETLLLWIYSPIPRTLWPTKPQLTLGPELENKIFKFGGGVPPGFIGELYWNFKLPAVIGGMFLLGMFLNWLYTSYKIKKTKNATLLYLFVMLNFSFNLLGISFGMVLTDTLTYVIPLVLAIYLFGEK